MYHYVYKITNKVNGKFYIGKHSTYDMDDGYYGSSTHLDRAISKYGIDNFEKSILKMFDTSDEAYEYEALVITEDMVKSPDCYNVQGGGKGWATGLLHHIHEKIKNGMHPSAISSLNGTHNWMGENNPSRIRVKDGTHHFQTMDYENRPAVRWARDGKNPFQLMKYDDRPAVVASKNGTHHWNGDSNPKSTPSSLNTRKIVS